MNHLYILIGGVFALFNSAAFPDNADAYYNIGVSTIHLDYAEEVADEGEAYFQKAVKLDPSPKRKQMIAEAWYSPAEECLDNDQIIQAVYTIRRAIKYYQRNPDPNFAFRVHGLTERVQFLG